MRTSFKDSFKHGADTIMLYDYRYIDQNQKRRNKIIAIMSYEHASKYVDMIDGYVYHIDVLCSDAVLSDELIEELLDGN